MRKLFIAAAIMACCVFRASADEGMWLLPYLQKMNIQDMKEKGFKLSAEDVYNVNGNSLKDAIVIFGNGCTGEIVSKDGLLFTNHHCGYGNIQALSSVEHDYLKNGFWAMNRAEELPAAGLSVRFIRKIYDVTDEILAGVTETMSESERDEIVSANMPKVREEYSDKHKGEFHDEFGQIMIRDFFGGNQFFCFVIEEFRDVRLVGAPPASIGKFGGETDNWMWPRHTGDFSIFRVYSDKDGKPAEYSRDNVPYEAPTHLKVSLKGFDEGDYAMIMGFPGSTSRYMTSWEIDQTLEYDNPTRIFIRGVRQSILRDYMEKSDEINIQYANKYANSSNYWKNSIGMSRGLKNLNVKAKKEEIERNFTRWVDADASRSKYSRALPLIQEAVEERTPLQLYAQYFSETLVRAVDIVMIARYHGLMLNDTIPAETKMERLREAGENFYKDYNEQVDRDVAEAMLKILFDRAPQSVISAATRDEFLGAFNDDIAAYVDYLYGNSVFANQAKYEAYIAAGDFDTVEDDPAIILSKWAIENYNNYITQYFETNKKFNEGHRLLIAGLMEMEPEKMHYPDANFTLRMTYGNILPYSPADGVIYDYYTTLSGVIAKEDTTNPMEFTVPERLKELYYAKDFGQYEYNGDVPVGFLSNNDITGGNSGSPVLNAYGELIGLAFDGNWEAMSGDIAFEPELQRTINVDIRYVLFIVDKFAGAGYLLDEMTIVR